VAGVSTRVVYIGPEAVFRGLTGRLVEAEERSTRRRRLHFQPESDGIAALPCEAEDVRSVEDSAAEEVSAPIL
jgi:hypothetical protein